MKITPSKINNRSDLNRGNSKFASKLDRLIGKFFLTELKGGRVANVTVRIYKDSQIPVPGILGRIIAKKHLNETIRILDNNILELRELKDTITISSTISSKIFAKTIEMIGTSITTGALLITSALCDCALFFSLH